MLGFIARLGAVRRRLELLKLTHKPILVRALIVEVFDSAVHAERGDQLGQGLKWRCRIEI